MITRIEALNFRSLQFVSQPLEPLQILVGPNASGKSTFLDTISFLGTLVSKGVDEAFWERSQNPADILWQRSPNVLELAIEAAIPPQLIPKLRNGSYSLVRYEINITVDNATFEPNIAFEKAFLKKAALIQKQERLSFPDPPPPRSLNGLKASGSQTTILNKSPKGNDKFYSEVYSKPGKGWVPTFKLGPKKSALGNMPADDEKFPVASHLRNLLVTGIQKIMLNSLLLRQASSPALASGFRPDGSNLPWVVDMLRKKHFNQFKSWLRHLRSALPNIEDITVTVRDDDRHAYLNVHYAGGLKAPSWVISDGTLRMMALTIIPYLPNFNGVVLVEEPENGIHPTAVQTIFESLSSVYEGQVLIASHSPVLLSIATPSQLLCFAKNEAGATDIVRGDQHPALQDWKNEVSLGSMFASGILS
jgi:predicted ATPase